jgi:hypothetical protein
MDALGLNVLKLDHVRESQRDISRQRNDCGRPLWHMGLYTYIASQLIGSTIALSKYLNFSDGQEDLSNLAYCLVKQII